MWMQKTQKLKHSKGRPLSCCDCNFPSLRQLVMSDRKLQFSIVLLLLIVFTLYLVRQQQLETIIEDKGEKHDSPQKSTYLEGHFPEVDYSGQDIFAPAAINDPSQFRKFNEVKKLGIYGNKIATLMETRPHERLPLVINSMISQISPDWLFRLYLSEEAAELLMKDQKIAEHIHSGKIIVVIINHDFKHPGPPIVTVSNFMKQRTFWENLAPATWVLVFQLDSVLCTPPTTGSWARPNEKRKKIEDYFIYDMIGAPLDCKGDGPGQCEYNGGLSLRNRPLLLQIIDENIRNTHDWDAEDRFFSRNLKRMGKRLPSREEAAAFSVQEEFPKSKTIFGIHQIWRSLHGKGPETDKKEQELIERCPEYTFAGPNEIL